MKKTLQLKFMAFMSKMMISCDKAAFLTSKAENGKLSLLDKIELKIHLVSCKYCQRYEKEIKLISQHIHNQNQHILDGKNGYHLSGQHKAYLNQLISSELEKN